MTWRTIWLGRPWYVHLFIVPYVSFSITWQLKQIQTKVTKFLSQTIMIRPKEVFNHFSRITEIWIKKLCLNNKKVIIHFAKRPFYQAFSWTPLTVFVHLMHDLKTIIKSNNIFMILYFKRFYKTVNWPISLRAPSL